ARRRASARAGPRRPGRPRRPWRPACRSPSSGRDRRLRGWPRRSCRLLLGGPEKGESGPRDLRRAVTVAAQLDADQTAVPDVAQGGQDGTIAHLASGLGEMSYGPILAAL